MCNQVYVITQEPQEYFLQSTHEQHMHNTYLNTRFPFPVAIVWIRDDMSFVVPQSHAGIQAGSGRRLTDGCLGLHTSILLRVPAGGEDSANLLWKMEKKYQ